MDITKKRKRASSETIERPPYTDLTYRLVNLPNDEGDMVSHLQLSGFIRNIKEDDNSTMLKIAKMNSDFLVGGEIVKDSEDFKTTKKLNTLLVNNIDSGTSFKLILNKKGLKSLRLGFSVLTNQINMYDYKISYTSKRSSVISSLNEKVDGTDSYVYNKLLGVQEFLSDEGAKQKMSLLSSKILRGGESFSEYGSPRNTLYVSCFFHLGDKKIPVLISVSKTMLNLLSSHTRINNKKAKNPEFNTGIITSFEVKDKANMLFMDNSFPAIELESEDHTILDTARFNFHISSLINTYFLLKENKAENIELNKYLVELGILESKNVSKQQEEDVVEETEDFLKDDDEDEIPF